MVKEKTHTMITVVSGTDSWSEHETKGFLKKPVMVPAH